ncbi:MAG: ATP-binding protein [Robiginitomaculum sp.]|nr:ATP-binding protein [Robiginitomaculum sp.]
MLKRYKTLTKKTLRLLDAGESDLVDYKIGIKGLSPEILVAFANSKGGGTILIGVEDGKDSSDKQIGIPIGHDSSDETLLIISNKASDCIPPIPHNIFVEKFGIQAIIRVEIPDSLARPHCTKSGVYKIRANSRNASLQPNELLDIFMEKEASAFNTRFRKATSNIENNVALTIQTVSKLEETIEDTLNDIMGDIGMAELNAEEATNTIDEVKSIVAQSFAEISLQKIHAEEQASRTQSLLTSLNAPDPSQQKFFKYITEHLKNEIEKNPLIPEHILKVEKLEFKVAEIWLKLLGDETVQKLLKQAITELSHRNNDADITK